MPRRKPDTPEFDGITSEQAGEYIQRRREARGLTQPQMADRTGVPSFTYYSALESGKPDFRRSRRYLEPILRELGITAGEARQHLGVKLVLSAGDPDEARFGESVGLEMRPLIRAPYYNSGAGPVTADEEAAGMITLADDGFLARYPKGFYLRIDGTCLEPDYPEGWFVSVIPDAALASPGSPVCVWMNGDGRVVKFLGETREDGDHLLIQTNPRKVVTAPVGSVILGVVWNVYPPRAPRLGAREVADALESENGPPE